MTDFTTTTTIDKNFDFEKISSENHSIRKNNTLIILIAAVLAVGFTFYNIREQYKSQKSLQ